MGFPTSSYDRCNQLENPSLKDGRGLGELEEQEVSAPITQNYACGMADWAAKNLQGKDEWVEEEFEFMAMAMIVLHPSTLRGRY